VSAPEEREQNWYPVSQVGWFTAHIRKGIAVTGHQLELLQLGPAMPGTASCSNGSSAGACCATCDPAAPPRRRSATAPTSGPSSASP